MMLRRSFVDADRKALQQRLERELVADGTGCWPWQGKTNGHGYGYFSHRGVHYFAHRAAWQVYRGPIPPKMQVNHHCDRPLCCHPDCLWLGTQRENLEDMTKKGRRRNGLNPLAFGETHGGAKISEAEAIDILAMREEGFTLQVIADEKGISIQHVSAIVNGKAWKHLQRKV
jgi:hypothetical protein